MSPDTLSQALFLVLFALLSVAWLTQLVGVLTHSEARLKLANQLARVALAWNIVALGHRWIAADHAPWANQFESATVVAFGVVLLYQIFQREHRVPLLGLLVLPAAMVAIAAASLLPQEYKRIAPLMPALQSYWLKIHVSLMLVSYGAFATTFALSLMYLVRDGAWTQRTTWKVLPLATALGGLFFAYVHAQARSPFWNSLMARFTWTELAGDTSKAYGLFALLGLLLGGLASAGLNRLPARLVEGLPDTETLEELNYRSVAVGFPLLTLGVILGAFWGHVAWGRYWGWDPKETWAFITWMIFAFFLHARVSQGWNGRRLAWVGLFGAGSIVFTYWGVNFLLSGLHAYAKP